MTGTLPVKATYCPSASAFIMYAGSVLTTPATLWSSSSSHAVTSASPPNTRTVPASYSASLSYFSAKSAYLAAVAVPTKNAPLTLAVVVILPVILVIAPVYAVILASALLFV